VGGAYGGASVTRGRKPARFHDFLVLTTVFRIIHHAVKLEATGRFGS